MQPLKLFWFLMLIFRNYRDRETRTVQREIQWAEPSLRQSHFMKTGRRFLGFFSTHKSRRAAQAAETGRGGVFSARTQHPRPSVCQKVKRLRVNIKQSWSRPNILYRVSVTLYRYRTARVSSTSWVQRVWRNWKWRARAEPSHCSPAEETRKVSHQ